LGSFQSARALLLRDYGTLAPLSRGYFPDRIRFPSITHPFAALLRVHDLHALSTPPAFTLSQDQTLLKRGSEAVKNTKNKHTPYYQSSAFRELFISYNKKV